MFYGYKLYCGYKLYYNLWQPKVACVVETNIWNALMNCSPLGISFHLKVQNWDLHPNHLHLPSSWCCVRCIPRQWKVKFHQSPAQKCNNPHDHCYILLLGKGYTQVNPYKPPFSVWHHCISSDAGRAQFVETHKSNWVCAKNYAKTWWT